MSGKLKFWGGVMLALAALVGYRVWEDGRAAERATARERQAAQARQAAYAKLVAAAPAAAALAREKLSEKKIEDAESALAPFASVKGPEIEAARREIEAAKDDRTVEKAAGLFAAGDVSGAVGALPDRLVLNHPGGKALYAKMKPTLDREREKVAAAERAAKKRQGVRIGMTREDALASSWGKPQRVNTTTYAGGRVHEQWVYGGQNYLYFENGILVTIQN